MSRIDANDQPNDRPEDRAVSTPTSELLEMAVLAAMGLLDEEEQRSFDIAFSAAPDQVRASVQADMERALDIRSLLPGDEPRPELRQLVIERIRREMAAEQPAAAETGLDIHAPASIPFPQHARRRVAPLWRSISIGLLAACLALGTFVVQLVQDLERVDSEHLMAQVQEEIGARFVVDTLFSDGTERVIFTAVSPTVGDAQAALWYNPDWQHARLYYRNLPDLGDRGYVLAEVDAEGEIVRRIVDFRPTGVLTSIRAPIALQADRDPPRLAIFTAGPGGSPELVMRLA